MITGKLKQNSLKMSLKRFKKRFLTKEARILFLEADNFFPSILESTQLPEKSVLNSSKIITELDEGQWRKWESGYKALGFKEKEIKAWKGAQNLWIDQLIRDADFLKQVVNSDGAGDTETLLIPQNRGKLGVARPDFTKMFQEVKNDFVLKNSEVIDSTNPDSLEFLANYNDFLLESPELAEYYLANYCEKNWLEWVFFLSWVTEENSFTLQAIVTSYVKGGQIKETPIEIIDNTVKAFEEMIWEINDWDEFSSEYASAENSAKDFLMTIFTEEDLNAVVIVDWKETTLNKLNQNEAEVFTDFVLKTDLNKPYRDYYVYGDEARELREQFKYLKLNSENEVKMGLDWEWWEFPFLSGTNDPKILIKKRWFNDFEVTIDVAAAAADPDELWETLQKLKNTEISKSDLLEIKNYLKTLKSQKITVFKGEIGHVLYNARWAHVMYNDALKEIKKIEDL